MSADPIVLNRDRHPLLNRDRHSLLERGSCGPITYYGRPTSRCRTKASAQLQLKSIDEFVIAEWVASLRSLAKQVNEFSRRLALKKRPPLVRIRCPPPGVHLQQPCGIRSATMGSGTRPRVFARMRDETCPLRIAFDVSHAQHIVIVVHCAGVEPTLPKVTDTPIYLVDVSCVLSVRDTDGLRD